MGLCQGFVQTSVLDPSVAWCRENVLLVGKATENVHPVRSQESGGNGRAVGVGRAYSHSPVDHRDASQSRASASSCVWGRRPIARDGYEKFRPRDLELSKILIKPTLAGEITARCRVHRKRTMRPFAFSLPTKLWDG